MKIGWVRLCDIILGKEEQKSGLGWVIGLVGLYVKREMDEHMGYV